MFIVMNHFRMCTGHAQAFEIDWRTVRHTGIPDRTMGSISTLRRSKASISC